MKSEKILNNRFYYDKFQYFVKWLKSFECNEIQKLIRDFHEKYFDKSAKREPDRKRIKIWFYWAFLVRSRHTYITLMIIIEGMNAWSSWIWTTNSIWIRKKQFTFSHYLHSLHYHWKTSNKHHFFLAFFHQKSYFACAFDSKSQWFWFSWSLFENSSMSFLFFHLFYRRDLFLCVSLCLRHVNEIRNLIVIKSMIVFIFFHQFRRRDKISHAVFFSKVETTMFERIYSTSENVANFFDNLQFLLRKTCDIIKRIEFEDLIQQVNNDDKNFCNFITLTLHFL